MDDATAHAMQYLALTDAMGYTAGTGLLSPEEYAVALRKDAERLDWLQAHDKRFYNIDRITAVVGSGFNGRDTLRDAIDAAMAVG